MDDPQQGQPVAMLQITPEAGLAIQKLTQSQGVGQGGGLRVEAREGEPAFDMSIAALPDETDLVVMEETTGARVMLDTVTADFVDDKTLDVSDDVSGTASGTAGSSTWFELTNQGAAKADRCREDPGAGA